MAKLNPTLFVISMVKTHIWSYKLAELLWRFVHLVNILFRGQHSVTATQNPGFVLALPLTHLCNCHRLLVCEMEMKKGTTLHGCCKERDRVTWPPTPAAEGTEQLRRFLPFHALKKVEFMWSSLRSLNKKTLFNWSSFYRTFCISSLWGIKEKEINFGNVNKNIIWLIFLLF